MPRTKTAAKATDKPAENTASKTAAEQPMDKPAEQQPSDIKLTLTAHITLPLSKRDDLVAAVAAQLEGFTHELKVLEVKSDHGPGSGKWAYEKGFADGKRGRPFDKTLAAEHPRYARGYEGGSNFRLTREAK